MIKIVVPDITSLSLGYEYVFLNPRTLEFRYRLPRRTEAETYALDEQAVGCWCDDGEEKVMTGIPPARWQSWQANLKASLNQDVIPELPLAHLRFKTATGS